MKKLFAFLFSALLVLAPVPASAATAQTHLPYPAGGSAASSASGAQGSGSTAPGYYVRGSSGGYHSGFRSPSSGVSRSPSSGQYSGRSNYNTAPRFGGFGGFGSHLFSFGSGMLLGSMFHPFGGYYGGAGMYGYHGFSFFSLIFDVLLLYIVYRLVRRLFFRR